MAHINAHKEVGLSQKTIDALINVFKKNPEIVEAVLYGSRAKGNYRPNSDIDLTLKGKNLDLSALWKIELELDDLLLPYQIDLSLYQLIKQPALLEHIDRVGVVFYSKASDA
jgi:predicted nucleotidyltransferase